MSRSLFRSSSARSIAIVSGLSLALATGAAIAPMADAPWGGGRAHAEVSAPRGGPASFAPVVKAVAPAVVHIEVTKRAEQAEAPDMDQMPPGMREFFERFFGDRGAPFHNQPRRGGRPEMHGLGSGFLIDASGYVVTNNHVVNGADEVVVTLHSGEKLNAELIGIDSRTDLALLKVERDKPFPFVAFGDSDTAEVGDWIVAVGNPFGLDHTVTTGIVSARGRSIGAGPYDDFLQIDAPINKGNSGGPAFNLAGEVVGVNTAIFSPTGGSVGIGFAIPSNLARDVIEQLKERGTVERGWLGVAIQMVTPDIAESVGLEKPAGAIVSNVSPDGPAAKAGLKVGDVITKVNGEAIEEMPELPRVIAAIPPGEDAAITVWRNQEPKSISVTLGRLPDEDVLAQKSAPAPAQKDEALGMSFGPLDDASRRAAGLEPDAKGVLIVAVDDDSQIAAKGVEPGAVLLAVAGEPVTSPSEAADRIRTAGESDRSSVLLLIRQSGADRFVAAPLHRG